MVNQLMQLYKHNTSRDGTHRQARGRSVDLALLVEELAEFLQYSYSQGLAWSRKKWLYWLIVFYNNRGPIFIPETQTWILLKYDSLQFLEQKKTFLT